MFFWFSSWIFVNNFSWVDLIFFLHQSASCSSTKKFKEKNRKLQLLVGRSVFSLIFYRFTMKKNNKNASSRIRFARLKFWSGWSTKSWPVRMWFFLSSSSNSWNTKVLLCCSALLLVTNNPGGDISKRATGELLLSKRPDFQERFRIKKWIWGLDCFFGISGSRERKEQLDFLGLFNYLRGQRHAAGPKGRHLEVCGSEGSKTSS